MGQLDPLLIDNRYPPVDGECMVGDYITKCIWYNCFQFLGAPPVSPVGNIGDYSNSQLYHDWRLSAWESGDVIIRLLAFDEVPKCGDCPTLPFIKTWLENNPTKIFPEIVDDPVAYLQLKQYVELNGGKLKIGVPTVALPEKITYQGKDYLLNGRNATTWKRLLSSNPTNIGSMPAYPDEDRCIDMPGNTGCPQHGKMPWFQGPFLSLELTNTGITTSSSSVTCKHSKTSPGLCASCLMNPPPNGDLHCNVLYELDDANVKNRPIAVNSYGPAKEFISVYQKWVDINKSHPQFDEKYKNAVVLFYGYIEGGIDPATGQPTYTNSQGIPDANIYKVFLETWKLDNDYKLVRDTNSFQNDQSNIIRKYIYITPAPTIANPAPPVSNKNLVILFDTNTGQLIEIIVDREPEVLIPEQIIVRYIPNTAKFLSETNPTEFSRLKLEYQKKFANDIGTGTCCFMSVDAKSVYRIGCLSDMTSEGCTIDRLNEDLLTNPENKVVIVESYFTTGVDCSEANCQFDIPRSYPSALGTCCYITETDPEVWGCKVNTQSECSNLEGFWQPAQPDGLGGYNPPSCSSGGIQCVPLDDSTVTTIFIGPRDCSIYEQTNPTIGSDNPGVVNGACCSIVATKTIDPLILTNSVIHTKTVTIPAYRSNTGSVVSSSDVNFTMLNDGSIVKLCFNNPTVFDNYMNSVSYDNSKIESDFSVMNNGQATSDWKTTVNKIEGNCIILSVDKQ
jgi:hypothetical protein